MRKEKRLIFINQIKVRDSLDLISNDLIDKNIISCIKKLQVLDVQLNNFENSINLLDKILIDIDEVRASLEGSLKNLNYNNQNLQEIELRISTLSSLARKYNINENFLYEELENYKKLLDY